MYLLYPHNVQDAGVLKPAWTRAGPYVHATVWLLAALLRTFNRTRVTGQNITGPRIYAVNHLAFTDIYLIGCCLVRMREPIRYVAKKELATAPFFGWVYRQLATIFVDRDHPERATIEESIVAAQHGALLIFPEGTRSRNRILGEGKAGVGVIAKRALVPVVPVSVVGTEHAVAKLLFGWLVPSWRVHVHIGVPYHPTPAERSKDVADRIMRDIAQHLPPDRRGRYSS